MCLLEMVHNLSFIMIKKDDCHIEISLYEIKLHFIVLKLTVNVIGYL